MNSFRFIRKNARGKTYLIAGALLLVLLAGGIAIKLIRDNPQQTPPDTTQPIQQEPTQDTGSTPSPSPETLPSKSSNNASTTDQTATPPVTFAVSSLVLHAPEIVYNQDRFGNSYKACKVEADISVTGSGEVTFYWDTYHPEYFTPSFKTDEEKLLFDGKGTKTVKLDTYVSDDNRRFTIAVVTPNEISKETATQVWCPKN